MNKLVFVCSVLLLLSGCTRREAPAPAPVPVIESTAAPETVNTPRPEAIPVPVTPTPEVESAPTPTPVPTPALPVTAGSYRWEGGWLLNLKDNGTFAVIHGDRIYNGEGWSDNGDGTVTTGPTEAAGAAGFFDEFGSSMWRIEGQTAAPIG